MRVVDQIEESLDANLGRDGCDALLDKCLDAAEALAHADAGPDGPFEGQAMAVRVLALKLFGEMGEPFVGEGVIGFSTETGAANDGAECHEELEALRVERSQDVAEAVDLRSKGVLKVGYLQLVDQFGNVGARSVQYSGDGSELALGVLNRSSDGRGIGNVCCKVTKLNVRCAEAIEVRGEFGIVGWVGTAKDRETNLSVASEGEGAFSGDAFAAASDEEKAGGDF